MGPSRSAGFALETHPSAYRHWRLAIEPPLATLTLAVAEDSPIVPGYKLKLNSYDLGVDIELADAVARLRFEHPEVRAVIVTGGLDRVFCAGANIHMLATSTHGFKVNFCKYTNETRLAIEDACAHSGQHYIAACNGTTAGGGYELALACEEIYLVDDGNSAVSLPEVPLLGVLPGTGGLTRVSWTSARCDATWRTFSPHWPKVSKASVPSSGGWSTAYSHAAGFSKRCANGRSPWRLKNHCHKGRESRWTRYGPRSPRKAYAIVMLTCASIPKRARPR